MSGVDAMNHYIAMREKYPMKQIGDSVHAIHGATECGAELKFSDLKEVSATIAAIKAENERLREALTPSSETKAAYIGEFSFNVEDRDEDGEECTRNVVVPWTTVKEIMKAIAATAAITRQEERT